MFLEPESGLGWFNASAKTLELVLGVQSPYEAAEALADMLGNAQPAFKPAHIKCQFAYMGGGFGEGLLKTAFAETEAKFENIPIDAHCAPDRAFKDDAINWPRFYSIRPPSQIRRGWQY